MASPATVTVKWRPRAKGSDEGRFYVWIRRPRPEKDELIRVKGATRAADRPVAEVVADTYRAALRQIRATPEKDDATAWFERYVEVHEALGNGTSQHMGDWKRYVAPFVEGKGMVDVTPDDIKRVRDNLTRARLDGKITAKRALNVWSTVVKSPFSRAFTDDDPKYASVRVGPHAANPAHDGIKPPVTRDDCAKDERERQALEPEEGAALLSCEAIPVEARRFYAWAMFTGLRPAELYGLTWPDVRERVIKVQRGRDMKTGEDGATKNRQSNRDVPIHPHLQPLIAAMRGSGRVFPVARVRDVEGRVDELRAHLRLAGITRPELHDGTSTLRPFDVRSFRTCFATWCARSGFDSAWIDAWLGHLPKTTAARHYVKDTGALTAGVFPSPPSRLCERNVNASNDSATLQCEGRDLNPVHCDETIQESAKICEPVHMQPTSNDVTHAERSHPAVERARSAVGVDELRACAAMARAARELLRAGLAAEARPLVERLVVGLEALVGDGGVVIDLTARRRDRA